MGPKYRSYNRCLAFRQQATIPFLICFNVGSTRLDAQAFHGSQLNRSGIETLFLGLAYTTAKEHRNQAISLKEDIRQNIEDRKRGICDEESSSEHFLQERSILELVRNRMVQLPGI